MAAVASFMLRRSALAGALFFIIGLTSTSPAAWAADIAWDNCSKADPEVSIAGCSQVLARGAKETRARQVVAYHNRGISFGQKGDYVHDIADNTKAIELDPRYADAYLELGRAYGQSGDYDRDIAAETKAIELNPKLASAYDNRASAYLRKADNDRAISDETNAIEIDPKDAFAYLNRAYAYARSGDADREIADATKVIELDPNSSTAYQDRGAAYGTKGDYDREIADETKAIELDPKNAYAYLARGQADWNKDNFIGAIAEATKAIELDPKFANAYIDRGAAYAGEGDYDRMIADETKAIELTPESALPYANRSEGYLRKHDFDRAIADASKAIALSPPNDKVFLAIAYVNRGYALTKKGDYEAGLADLNKAIELNAKDNIVAAAYGGRGLLYFKKSDYNQALADLNKSIELKGNSKADFVGYVFQTRGDVYAAKGESESALADYRVAVRLLPERAEEKGQALAQIAELEKRISPAAAGGRLALVIGNADYVAVGKLANPERDATVIAATLRDDGFDVTMVENVNRADFLATINRFSDGVANADLAVIYFAGHGLQLDGVNYLVPVDAKLTVDRDVQDEAIALDRVISAVRGARKLGLIIVDACRNNPFLANMRLSESTRDARTRGLARVTAHGTTLVEFSAQEGQEALDGDDPTGNSPFAAALARRLAAPGVELNKALRHVREDVLTATNDRQEPMFSGNLPAEDVFFREQ